MQKSEKNLNFEKKILIEILDNNDHIKFILVDNGIGFNNIKGKIKDILRVFGSISANTGFAFLKTTEFATETNP